MRVKRVFGLISSVILVVLPAACDDDDDGKELTTFVHEYCELHEASCCAKAGGTYDGQSCEAFLILFSPSGFNKSAGDNCLAQLRGAQSSATFCTDHGGQAVDDACDAVFPKKAGAAAPGGSCSTSSDCAPVQNGDVSCVSADSGSDARICQALLRGAEGADCTGERANSSLGSFSSSSSKDPQTTVCWEDDKLFCKYDTKKCTAYSALGEKCSSSDYKSCGADAYCGPKDQTSTDYVCLALGKEGEACALSFSNTCAKGLHCSDDKKCTADLAAGAACTTNTECGTSGFCENGACQTSALGGSLFCKNK